MLRASCLVVIVMSLGCATASAQAPAGADFAGGTTGTGATERGSSEIGLRVDASGSRAAVRAVGVVGCAAKGRTSEANGEGTVTLAPDGTFSGTLSRGRQPRGPGFSFRMTVTGRVEAARATGTIQVTTTLRGRPYCRGSVPFDARPAPTLGADPAPPPAGGLLVGRTSGRTSGPFGLALRVSADGRRVQRIVSTYRQACRRTPGVEETNYSPRMTIRADGTFRNTERFTIRYSDAIERATVITTGRFVAGGATGTIRTRATARSRRTNRVVDRCDTGTLRWTVVP